MYIYAHTYIWINIYKNVYICTHIWIYTHTYTHSHIHTHTHTHTHIYIYIYIELAPEFDCRGLTDIGCTCDHDTI